MLRLTRGNLGWTRKGVARPDYDIASTSTGVVHFGPGVFFRAHAAWHLDQLLGCDPRWAVAAVSLRSGGLAKALREQDYLYTLCELDEKPRWRIIGALTDYLVGAVEPEKVFARLASPLTRLVTLTVTEKGYCFDGGGALDFDHPDIKLDLTRQGPPRSVIGWLAEGLSRRRAEGLPPFVVISCDNLSSNGPRLRAGVLALAEAWGDKELALWIGEEGRFPSTMVDSITPATDNDLKKRAHLSIGLIDEAAVQREPFTQWVIEDTIGKDMPDFASVGAIIARDVAPFEQAKLRLLNGAHSTLAYLGLLAGCRTTGEAMGDARIARFVERLMRENIARSLRPAPGLDVEAYTGDILKRFYNPAVRHSLRQIAADGSKKLPYRLIAPMADARRADRPVDAFAVPIAAWMRFVIVEAAAGRALDDPLAGKLAEIAAASAGEGARDVLRFLALDDMFPRDIAGDERIRGAVIAAYDGLAAHEGGAISAL